MIKKILFASLLTIGLSSGNTIVKAEDQLCNSIVKTIANDQISVNSSGIWSQPVAVKDSFTGESVLAVLDKHWEESFFGQRTDYFVSSFNQTGLYIYHVYVSHRTGISYQTTGFKQAELRVNDRVFTLKEKSEYDRFIFNDEIRKALSDGGEVKVRVTSYDNQQYIFPIGKGTVESYDRVICN